MTKTAEKTPAGMKGGVRRPRGPNGAWSFTLDMGLMNAQRCVECKHRVWVGPERLEACPKCGGGLRETRERRQVVQGGYPTQGVAKDERAKALVKLGKGSYMAPERMTLAEYLRDKWLPQIEREFEQEDLKATTLDSYRRNIREHLIGPRAKPFTLGMIELRKLTLEAVREHYAMLGEGYVVERRGKLLQHPGLGVQSRRRLHACLHRALNDAIEKRYIDTNPAWKGMKAQKNALRFEGSAWTGDELGAFLAATAGTQLYPLWFTVATTGLRRGEVCGLQWSDLDLVAGRLTVARSRVPVGGGVVESSPKSGESRTIPLDEDTVAVLERHRKAQAAAQLKAGPAWQGTGNYLFTSVDGSPVDPNRVSRAFRVAIDDHSMRRIRLHDLRHTHASLLLANGEPIGNVAYRLGHSDSNITAKVYEHHIPEAQRATATHFQSILRNARDKAV
jgi:Site-specific recombinase XerD